MRKRDVLMIIDLVVFFLVERRKTKKKNKDLEQIREPKDTTWKEDW